MRGIAITGNTFPFTITGNRTWSGFQTFQGTTGQSNPTAEFRAATSQTGNLLEFYNASGTRVAYFDQSGNFTSTGAVSYSSTAVAQGSAGIGFSVKAYGAGNSSDLQQWQNSAGTALLGITSAGALYGATGLAVSGTLSAAQGSFTTSGLANTVSLTDNGVDGANLELSSTQGTSTAPNKYLRSYAGQFQIRNSANGATIWALDDAGNVLLNKLQIRGDASTTDPGVAWLRNTATTGDLVVNPSGSGQLYLAWDVKNAVNVGGNALVNGTLTVDENNTNAGTKDILFGTGATEGIGSKRTAGGNQYGLDFYTANAVRAKIDNSGNFVSMGGTSLNYGTNTDALSPNSVSIYVNTASSGSTGGRFAFSSNGPTGNDGAYIEYNPAAAGNTANRINFTGSGAGQLSLFTISSANTVIGVNGVSGTGISIRGDNSSADPGMPWIRSDGSALLINPHSTGGVYLCWDNRQATYVGGSLTANGAIIGTAGLQIQNSGISTTGGGNIIANGTLYGHQNYPAVEANGSSNMHLEVYTNGGSQSTNSQNTWGMTINFARAFNNIPAIGASASTSAGIGTGAIGVGVRNPSTTSVSVYFQNLDSGTQTLSNASAVIAGTNN